MLCRALEVSTAAFYQFVGRPASAAKTKQAEVTSAIVKIHSEKHHDAYGSPRVHKELLRRGVSCCLNTVAKYMGVAGIAANRRTKFRISTTDSNHNYPIAPNLLNQDFATKAINEVWLTDITYIPTKEGFTYLAAIVDLYSRKIIGWKTSRKIDSQLVVAALGDAITFRSPRPGVIVHSDRGAQYASGAFREELSQHGLIQSMSRRGNCYDNAPMESFFKSYKTEEVRNEQYETHEQATRGASEFIEHFYTPVRLHSSLDYQSPIEFERSSQSRSH
ncbi:Integrase core domain protein [Roseimaritima multifibrata]|uniref:Integrase core domain protein n=1 Tax=Roseimaritima multifibrata TaxID=1930274 RepID=A0A517MJL1_9BACT|nr:Integrase core domain protein [Roseimaritima multifibrata]